jgi:FAD/FMN-containing dehydrogenase
MVTYEQGGLAATILDVAPWDNLRAQLRGTLVLPQSPGYDEVRKVFNGMIDRRPAAIAQVTGSGDVVAAVNFAPDHGVPLTIRGGGHGVAGHSVADDGLMIDFSAMKSVSVDVGRRVATVEAGVKLGELIAETERYGLVSPTGTASDTGVAGLTLGAGFGWLAGKFGLAVDNVLGAEVVTADGQMLHVSETEHPDLYWALRGGSGNFGVVTKFELKLYPLSQVLGGMILYPFDQARDVLRFYRDVAAAAPDELVTYAAILTLPEGPPAVAIICCWSGTEAEGLKVLAPIRAFGTPFADTIQPMPYSTMNTLVDDAVPPGLRYYWKESMLRELADDTIDTIVEHAARILSPRTVVLIDHVHGAAHRVEPTATAFPHRDSSHALVMLSGWVEPADDDANIAWTRELAAAIRPWATGGVYVNEAWDVSPTAAFGVNYERLAQVKARYDPANLFRHNANIAPAKAPGDS